jgi:phthalate 4,5-dioxygenase oxygenase subunit
MLTPEEHDLLCRVEGDAPMGQMMRRYWLPACLIEEVPEPDCDPVRVRLLGENLVAFRDSDGRVGLMAEKCPHRKASLFYGRNEEGGLRCLYHGWKFDVEGNCVDMSSEPAGSTLCEKVKHRAYPVQECGGVVWTYLGPTEEMPAFQRPIFAPSDTTRISHLKVVINCNWAQGLEGAIDSAHSSSLHSTDMPAARVNSSTATGTAWQRPTTDKSPRLQAQETDYGFRYAALRRPIQNAATSDYVRVTLFVAPFNVLIPPNNVYNVHQMSVPVDDTHNIIYLTAWTDTGEGVDQEAWRKFTGGQLGIDLDPHYRKIQDASVNYGQDRSAMKLGSFTGIRGFPNQDIAMQESMGAIADRSHEKLGASDLAIVEFRRVMVKAVRDFMASNKQPPALGMSEEELLKLASWERIVPKSIDWRDFDHAAGKLAAE